jgi:hypothetical protein
LDQRNQEKRKELEKRLGKICRIVRPLIDNHYLFREVRNTTLILRRLNFFSKEPMIDMDELQQIITDTEAEEKVIK